MSFNSGLLDCRAVPNYMETHFVFSLAVSVFLILFIQPTPGQKLSCGIRSHLQHCDEFSMRNVPLMYNPIVTNLILLKVSNTLCSWDNSLIQFINSHCLQLQGLKDLFRSGYFLFWEWFFPSSSLSITIVILGSQIGVILSLCPSPSCNP